MLNFSSGLEQRFYPQWSARQLNLPSLAKGEVYQTNDAIELTVSSLTAINNNYFVSFKVGTCLEKMYQLGCQLSKLHQVYRCMIISTATIVLLQIELKRTLDVLTEKLPNLLIQQGIN